MSNLTAYLSIMCVLIHSARGIDSTLQFCSESAVNNHMENLILDGTEAVQNLVSQSCKCTVSPLVPLPSSFKLLNELSTSATSDKRCNTKLDVFRSNGTLIRSIHCEQIGILIDTEEVYAGLIIYLHIFVDPNVPVLEKYKVHIMPDVKSQLIVHCSPGTDRNDPPGSLVSSTSSLASTTSTSRTPVSSGSSETVVIVGVVIGLGLFMLVFISCLLCYIARRPKSKNHIPQLAESQQVHRTTRHQNILQRTLTRARDRIIQPRPLPKIPVIESLRKFTLRRKVIDREDLSGYYASIRSENSNGTKISPSNNKIKVINDPVTQQLSVESSASYIHPNEVNTPNTRIVGREFKGTNRQEGVSTISDNVARKEDRDYSNVPYVSHDTTQEVGNKHTKRVKPEVNILKTHPQQTSEIVNSRLKDDDSEYILPNDVKLAKNDYVNAKSIEGHITPSTGRFGVNGNSNVDSNAEYLSLQNDRDYANVGLKRTDEKYNPQEKAMHSPSDNPCEKNTAEINTAHVDASCDDTYLPMKGVPDKVSKCTNKEDVSEHDIYVAKETLRDTDSAGYMSMGNCANSKDALKKMDSTFPNMMSFRAHGTLEQHEDSSNVEQQAIENNIKQNKNKVKRYVKEIRTP